MLIDGVTETVKHELIKTKRQISWRLLSTFSRFNNATGDFFSSKIIRGRGIGRAGRDVVPKAFQKLEFVVQLKKLDDGYNPIDATNDQSIFFLTILLKKKQQQRNEIKVFSRKCNSIINDEKLLRSKS